MLGKNNIEEQHRKERQASGKSQFSLRKVKTGVASVLVATSFAGVIFPLLAESTTVSAAENEQSEVEVEDSQFQLDSFRLTHLENHGGLFSERIGGQLKLTVADDITEGQKLAIDIYQESDAYHDGNKEAVKRFVVDTVTPVTINDGDETVVVGQFDGSTITFNSAIENYEDVQLTVHLGTVVEPSYLHYYVTKEETRTEVVPYATEIRYVYDPKLPEGEEEVLIEGVDGERTIVENVTYYLGEEAEREEISNEVTTEPVQEIIAVGVASEGDEDKEIKKAIEEQSKEEKASTLDLSAANEPVLVDKYNQTGVNHVYHVYLNGEHAGTTAIGFETPASIEIREERANDFEHVLSRYGINDEGKINTRLTFADVFSKFAKDEKYDGSETVRLTLTAESGTYFHKDQSLTGKVLGLTNALETDDLDSEEDLEVVDETDYEELFTDEVLGQLDVNVVYVDGRTLQIDVSLSDDLKVQNLGEDSLSERLLVIDGIQSTATIGEEPYSDDYKDLLETIDENLSVNFSYGTEKDGFETISEEKSTGLANAAGYVYETSSVSGKGTLVVPDVVIESETREEVVPYTTEIIEDDELPEGEKIVEVEGVDGVRTIVENVTYTDGEETDREVVSDEITTEPVIEIVRVGTLSADDVEESEDEPAEVPEDNEGGTEDEEPTDTPNTDDEDSEGEPTEDPIVDDEDAEEELTEDPITDDEDSEGEPAEIPTSSEVDEDGNPIDEEIDETEDPEDVSDEENDETPEGEEEAETALYGERLPDTATSIWTIGAIGGGLLSIGGLSKWLDRKKKQNDNTEEDEKEE